MLSVVLAMTTGACAPEQEAGEQGPPPDRIEIALSAADIVAVVNVPRTGSLGDLVTIEYEIRNPTDSERQIIVAGCEGPILARVSSDGGPGAWFRDSTRIGACDDIMEVKAIPSGGRIVGTSQWRAGAFSRGATLRDVASVEVTLTAAVDGEAVEDSGQAEISVGPAST